MMKNQKQPPHIGKRLRAYVKEHRISQAGWARAQKVSPKQIGRYLKQEEIRVSTLFKISQVLHYNFLSEIAGQLPDELPPQKENPLIKNLHASRTSRKHSF